MIAEILGEPLAAFGIGCAAGAAAVCIVIGIIACIVARESDSSEPRR
jgi:hypothetical protein